LKNVSVIVTDKGNGGKPACPGKWKWCKEERRIWIVATV
jgi:hypothetical protein